MLNGFNTEFKKIYKKYLTQNIDEKDFKYNINRLHGSWDRCRIDIKNTGDKNNSIEILGENKNYTIKYPKWFEDETGKGCSIETNENKLKLKVRCISDGELNLFLRAIDFRNIEKKRVAIYINYTKLTINNEVIFDENKLQWHNKAFEYKRPCKNKETLEIDIEFEKIYDYFPKLHQFWSEIAEETKDNIDIFDEYLEYKCNMQEEIINPPNEKNENLNEKIMKLTKQFNDFEKSTNKILDSYNLYFDNFFKYYETKPKKLVKNSHDLNLELLDFIDNVCKKYDLQWWLFAGTLLGALRHEGFIPWDDDLDISMIRTDYEKFLEIIQNEINLNNMQDFIKVTTSVTTNSGAFLPFMKIEYRVEGKLYGFIDIFPSDYITEVIDDMKNVYKKERDVAIKNLRKGIDRKEVLEKSFKKLNVSKTKTNFIIPGIENSLRSYTVYDYNTVFPLKLMQFEDRQYPCPNDSVKYTVLVYGKNYMRIPKIMFNHGFYDFLLKHENVYQTFEKHIKLLNKINTNLNKKIDYE